MDCESRLKRFNEKVEESYDFRPSPSELQTVCTDLLECSNSLTAADRVRSLKSMGYFCLGPQISFPMRIECENCFKAVSDSKSLALIIQDLRPMLLQVKNSRLSEQGRFKQQELSGLNPKKGLAFKEDEIRSNWAQQGGTRTVSLFYVVLGQLKIKDVSSNLGWIVPGILNLMDDTSDLEGIKLQGAVLLERFLTETVGFSSQPQFDFSGTGLFKVFEPILTSMWYHFPQSTDPNLTKKIWGTVFPTLIALYRVEFITRPELLYENVSKFLSEVLLQVTLPRIAISYPDLTIDTVDRVGACVQILGERSVIHLQRAIHVFGDYLIRSVQIQDLKNILHSVFTVLKAFIDNCPKDRVIAHRYNLLACALVACERTLTEQKLQEDENVQRECRSLIKALEVKGVVWTEEERQLMKSRVSSLDLEI
ncbi:LAFA_0F10616g1_1 [Lachancea sp. 'fantastica']|nr:LAFA_0F10616g1_1 [Lachancea sp. 'fantastica']